jgi:anti-sigma regulatory factor (Ser/Thr protein kinase)
MPERIDLEVPATLSALSTVRMVLGGASAHLDFSLEALDELQLATDSLFEAALGAEELQSFSVEILLEGDGLRVAAGSFCSPDLRARVGVTPGGCIDLCTLLRRLLDDVYVEERDGVFRVVMVKRGRRSGP